MPAIRKIWSRSGKNFPQRYIFIQADICDSHALEDIFDDYQVDTICNFAAESHVDRSIVNPGCIHKNQY